MKDDQYRYLISITNSMLLSLSLEILNYQTGVQNCSCLDYRIKKIIKGNDDLRFKISISVKSKTKIQAAFQKSNLMFRMDN